MLYNREQYRKIEDKKILRKKNKRWIIVSMALLGMIGAGASIDASADAITPNAQSNVQKTNIQRPVNKATPRQTVNNAVKQSSVVRHDNQSQPARRIVSNNANVSQNTVQHSVNSANAASSVRRQGIPSAQQRNNAMNTNTKVQNVKRPLLHTQMNSNEGTQHHVIRSRSSRPSVQSASDHSVQNLKRSSNSIRNQRDVKPIRQSNFNQQHPVLNSHGNGSAQQRTPRSITNTSSTSHVNQSIHAQSQTPSQASMKSTEITVADKQSTLASIASMASGLGISSVTRRAESAQENLANKPKDSLINPRSFSAKSNIVSSASSASQNNVNNSLDINSVLSNNTWGMASDSANHPSSNNSSEESVVGRHSYGFTPYIQDPNNVSGMVSDALSDEQEASTIANTNNGYYIDSYANDARDNVGNLNTIVNDYNTLLSGADYWRQRGNTSLANSVANNQDNLSTDHQDIMNLDSQFAYDDSMVNQYQHPDKTDTISFIYQDRQIGTATQTGKTGTQGTVNSNIPAGYRLANDGTQNIIFDGGTHQVDLLPNNDTDDINYIYEGKKVGATTMHGYSGTQVSADGSNMPTGYRLSGDSTNTFTMDNGTHDVDVIPITVPKQSTITVHYTDQAGNTSVSTVTGTSGQTGNDITSLAKVPAGYTLNGGQDTKFSFTDNPGNINLSITGDQQNYNVQVQINKYKEDGSFIGTDTVTKNISGKTGDTYTIDPNEFTPAGYQSQSSDLTGKFMSNGITNNDANFSYKQEKGAPVTVEYINQDKVPVATNTINGDYNQTGNITTAPVGYTIVPNQNTGYTITTTPQTIQIQVAGKNNNTLPDKGQAHVTLEKVNNGRIVDENTITVQIPGEIGDTYTLDPSRYTPNGYVSASPRVSGRVTPTGLTLENAKFTYIANTSNSIVVNFMNNNQQVTDSGVINGVIGSHVNIVDPQDGGIEVPEGYALNSGQNVDWTIQRGVQVADLNVTGGKANTSDFDAQIVLRRRDGNGNWITNGMLSKHVSIPESGAVGDTYIIDPNSSQIWNQIPNANDFVSDPGNNDIQGILQLNGLSRNSGVLYYDEKPSAQGGLVTVNYMDGNRRVDTERIGGAPDEYLNLLNSTPSGYSVANSDNYTNVMVTDQPQTINIQLSKNLLPNNPNNPTPSPVPASNSGNNTPNNNPASNSGSSANSSNNNIPSSSNNIQPNSASNGSIRIDYIDDDTGFIVKSTDLSANEAGDNFDPNFYNNLMPAGYQFDGDGDSVNGFNNGSQTFRIDVSRIRAPSSASNPASDNYVIPSSPSLASSSASNSFSPSSSSSSNGPIITFSNQQDGDADSNDGVTTSSSDGSLPDDGNDGLQISFYNESSGKADGSSESIADSSNLGDESATDAVHEDSADDSSDRDSEISSMESSADNVIDSIANSAVSSDEALNMRKSKKRAKPKKSRKRSKRSSKRTAESASAGAAQARKDIKKHGKKYAEQRLLKMQGVVTDQYLKGYARALLR